MVNIEVRPNGKFKIGYPYNSSIDLIFQNLSPEFISNYNLSDESVMEINNYKNKLWKFDLDLQTYVFQLSAFMIGFEQTGQVLINEYDKLKAINIELNNELELLETSKKKLVDEHEFLLKNISVLKNDLIKIDELLSYYTGQLIDNVVEYNNTYIVDTQKRLEIIDAVLLEDSEMYYRNTVDASYDEIVSLRNELKEYSFEETTLRDLYETWAMRSDIFYSNLLEYFKDEYSSTWNYGISLMYGQKIKVLHNKEKINQEIVSKVQDSIFKKKNFSIEKEIKLYSLNWLKQNSEFTNQDFNFVIETKKKEILIREIGLLEQTILEKQNNIRKVLSVTKENNYYLYRELVQEKRNYQIMNLHNIDSTIINDFDTKLAKIRNDYNYGLQQFNSKQYNVMKYDLDMYNSLLEDLRRQLEQSIRLLGNNFQIDLINNPEIKNKVNYYTKEKSSILQKITEINSMIGNNEITINVYNDKITILNSKIFENTHFIKLKSMEYISYFDERIPFFTQDVTISENIGLHSLLNGKFFKEFNNRLDEIKAYIPKVQWYQSVEMNQLISMYDYIVQIVDTQLNQEWNLEFNHDILNSKKTSIYSYYMEQELLSLYGNINKFINDKVEDSTIFDNTLNKVIQLKSIFKLYTTISFAVKEDIIIKLEFFDPSKTFKFSISQGNETIENVVSTFNIVMDNLSTFVYNKNLEFKKKIKKINDQEKIDQVWLDMEKKYV